MTSSLPGKLHRWVIEEMKYTPQGRHVSAGIPNVHDFRDVCRGQSADIWKFLVNNVHSAQTVRKVKGNLALKHQSSSNYEVKYKSGKTYSHEKSQLLEEKRKLSSELNSLNNSIQLVDKDLNRLQNTLLQAESTGFKNESSVHDTRHKTQLLKVYSKRCNDQIERYTELKKRLTARVDSYTSNKSGEKYFSKPAYGEGDKTIESACSKSVRESCETISSFLQRLLQGNFNTDKTQLDQKKERLWISVERVLQAHIVSDVISSIVSLIQDDAFNIRDQTANINISEDAWNLRFEYNDRSGQLTDVSHGGSNVTSVQQLIETEQLSHIDRFMQTQQIKNQAWRVSQELENLTEEYNTKLQRKYDGHVGSLQLARKCFQVNLQIAEAHSTIKVLQKAASELKQTTIQSAKAKEDLLHKLKRIQNFDSVVESKQNLIKVLVKHNSSSMKKLDSQKQQILQYLQTSVCPHEVDTVSMVGQLKHGITREVEAFTAVCLPYLMYTVLEDAQKVAVVDLSINRLNEPVLSTGHEALPKILDTIHFPRFKGPENLLPLAIDLKSQVDELSDNLTDQSGSDSQARQNEYSMEKISRLCQEVAKHDEELVSELQPPLQDRISRATDALSTCIQVKDAATAWWEQPAQDTVPWVKMDGRTFQQWKDKWRVAVTRLHQL